MTAAAASEYRQASKHSARALRRSTRFAPALLLVLSGCSFLIDVGEQQCVSDDDCALAGGAGACHGGVCVDLRSANACPDGTCAGTPAPPPPASNLRCGESACSGIAEPLDAYGCEGLPQGGLHFRESTGTALPFYLLNSLPNLDSELTMYDERTGYAVSGFFNVEPGFGIFSAHIGVDGPLLLSHNAVVRERALTLVDIRP